MPEWILASSISQFRIAENNMTRLQELCDSVARFNAVHNEWASSPNDPNPTIKYWSAYDQMIATFDGGDIPSKARQLAESVYRLAQQYVKFVAMDVLHPPDDFFAARQDLENVLSNIGAAQERKRPESVIELNRQGVPHQQIAKIWGLVNPDGTGKSWLIQQELDKPGSIISPDYVHPDDKVLSDTAAAAKREYERLASAASVVTTAQKEAEDRPCPETPQELWAQNVSPAQAAKMLKMPEDDVRVLWAKWTAEKNPQTTSTEAPIVPFIAAVPVAAEAIVESESNPDDPYDAFADWTDEHVREHAKELGLETRGRFVRNSMLDKILAAEMNGAIIPNEGDPVENVEEEVDVT